MRRAFVEGFNERLEKHAGVGDFLEKHIDKLPTAGAIGGALVGGGLGAAVAPEGYGLAGGLGGAALGGGAGYGLGRLGLSHYDDIASSSPKPKAEPKPKPKPKKDTDKFFNTKYKSLNELNKIWFKSKDEKPMSDAKDMARLLATTVDRKVGLEEIKKTGFNNVYERMLETQGSSMGGKTLQHYEALMHNNRFSSEVQAELKRIFNVKN